MDRVKTRGTVAILRVEATCNQSLVSINPNKEKIMPEILMYLLEQKYQEIRNLSGGGDRGGLNMSNIKELSILFPKKISEQKKIADILQKIDERIKKLQRAKNGS